MVSFAWVVVDMAWIRQYSAPNVVGARKLKALFFYTIIHFYTQNGHFAFHFAFLSPSFGRGGLRATYAVHLRLIIKPVMDFLIVIVVLNCLGVDRECDRETV